MTVVCDFYDVINVGMHTVNAISVVSAVCQCLWWSSQWWTCDRGVLSNCTILGKLQESCGNSPLRLWHLYDISRWRCICGFESKAILRGHSSKHKLWINVCSNCIHMYTFVKPPIIFVEIPLNFRKILASSLNLLYFVKNLLYECI